MTDTPKKKECSCIHCAIERIAPMGTISKTPIYQQAQICLQNKRKLNKLIEHKLLASYDGDYSEKYKLEIYEARLELEKECEQFRKIAQGE